MTRTELKQMAQDELISTMQAAFDHITELNDSPELRAEMDKQFTRVEKLFGYDLGSWTRGV